ncbi:MAG: 50S ribosomal protein L29 [Planctomycetota bacterium]|jgi:large subunit ribosomal protein L29
MNERENTASFLRGLTDDQLAAQAKDAANTLFRLRVQAQTDRLDVPSEMRRNRQLIARIKTIMNERARKS